ncbi:MAG: asparagine synthase (glutamine-hydrolyzing) [Nitrospiraceae bacterium]|nr:asparagine synthase (glutamine-hydrolyzing) [Nitrospiraceae bacterium]
MCGITGIVDLQGRGIFDPDDVRLMTGAIAHRGPDGSGVYMDDYASLGHARLSIIDLSGGSQPIPNEDRTLWIIYNGEVFNYPELRESLARRGHRFLGHTDTEVILHLYEEKGPACLEDLNGQFAIAIWNAREKELFLARDRMGIRPLYYARKDGALVFASEIKAIFMLPQIPRQIDPVAMDQIFTFWTTLGGRTPFQGVSELLPGHYLKMSAGSFQARRYWQLPLHTHESEVQLPPEEICGHIIETLTDAVRIRLRADVPVGCYLSGGLDSSGVAALVRNNFQDRLRTFGIKFEEKGFDESGYQDSVVRRLGTEHRPLLVKNRQIGEVFPDVVWHCEKPLLRTAPGPLFLLSGLVRESGLKVVMTGEGADEVFAGYNIFREAKIRKFCSDRPGSTRRRMLFSRLYPYIFKPGQRGRHFINSFFSRGLEDAGDPLFSHLIRWRNTGRLKTFFSEGLRSAIGDYSSLEELRQTLPAGFDALDYLSKAQYLETAIFLGNYLLSSQGDRVAMANSIEIRLPYLDYRLVEFMARVPSKWKINVLNEKYLLKKVFEGILPETVVNRPKHPYRAPVGKSLMKPGLPYAQEMLSARSLRESGLFDPGKAGMLLDRFRRSAEESELDGMALSGILSSQILHDRFISSFPRGCISPCRPAVVFDMRRKSGRINETQHFLGAKNDVRP